MASIISNPQSGITSEELKEAIPESLLSKDIYLHWIDKSRADGEKYILTAKIEIDSQILLLQSKIGDTSLIEDWNVKDPAYHTNARLVALERILTDPENEDKLMSM